MGFVRLIMVTPPGFQPVGCGAKWVRRHGDLDGLEEARRGILAQREGKGLAGWTALGDTPLSTTQGDVH